MRPCLRALLYKWGSMAHSNPWLRDAGHACRHDDDAWDGGPAHGAQPDGRPDAGPHGGSPHGGATWIRLLRALVTAASAASPITAAEQPPQPHQALTAGTERAVLHARRASWQESLECERAGKCWLHEGCEEPFCQEQTGSGWRRAGCPAGGSTMSLAGAGHPEWTVRSTHDS